MFLAMGLMSETSREGIDAAVIRTGGLNAVEAIDLWRLIVCGGGRKNATMLAMIEKYAGVETVRADTLGWADALGRDSDAIEAQGFAYLAYRCLHRLPIIYPGTTGVSEPMSAGIVFKPRVANTRLAAA